MTWPARCRAGTIEPLGLPYDSYRLALTPDLLDKGVPARRREPAARPGGRAGARGRVRRARRGLVDAGRAGLLLRRSGRRRRARSWREAQAHFFLPRRFSDPFGRSPPSPTTRTTCSRCPRWIRSATWSAPASGRLTARWRRADTTTGCSRRAWSPTRTGTGPRWPSTRWAWSWPRRSWASPRRISATVWQGFDPDPSEAAILADLADPLTGAPAMLGRATTRLIYDLFGVRPHQGRSAASAGGGAHDIAGGARRVARAGRGITSAAPAGLLRRSGSGDPGEGAGRAGSADTRSARRVAAVVGDRLDGLQQQGQAGARVRAVLLRHAPFRVREGRRSEPGHLL